VLATISRWVKAGRAERILALREPAAVVELLEQEGG
jgi:hypothetical protein